MYQRIFSPLDYMNTKWYSKHPLLLRGHWFDVCGVGIRWYKFLQPSRKNYNLTDYLWTKVYNCMTQTYILRTNVNFYFVFKLHLHILYIILFRCVSFKFKQLCPYFNLWFHYNAENRSNNEKYIILYQFWILNYLIIESIIFTDP